MKKFIFCIIFITLCILSFGQENRTSVNMEISSGYSFFNSGIPVQFGINVSIQDIIIIKTYFSFMGLSGDFRIPQEEAYRLDNDHYKFMFGMEMFTGVGFFLYNTERLKVPLMAGIYINLENSWVEDTRRYWVDSISYIYGADNYQYFVSRYGLGLNIGLQFHFYYHLYLFGMVQGFFSFINTHDTFITVHLSSIQNRIGESIYFTRNIDFSPAWGINPQLGIGFRF